MNDSPSGASDATAVGGKPATGRVRRLPGPGTVIVWIVVAVVVVGVPFWLQGFRVEQVTAWIVLAIAATGLNLLTGYNGQISIGHGALYGIGAYTAGLMITRSHSPLLVAVVVAGVVCFAAGVVIGLPALRIKGLYLALVTLALATLFPFAVEQFRSITGGNQGLEIRSDQYVPSRDIWRSKPVKLASPFEWLDDVQWQYFVFLVILAICLVIVRNLVKSRVGRSIVAIRDNETAAAVSGIPIATTKIITFGTSAAIAGIAGGLFAIKEAQIRPTSFGISESIFFLVVVVIGGSATVMGPVIGAVAYGVFNHFIIPALPDRLQPASMVIIGLGLAVQVLVAPGGITGSFAETRAKLAERRAAGGADT